MHFIGALYAPTEPEMRVPTRLSLRDDQGRWSSEAHPSFEHALMRWMSIPVRERRGGFLSPSSSPEPRLPTYAEIGKVRSGTVPMGKFGIGLLCVSRDLAMRMRHRIVTEMSGLDIDSADEYPRVKRIVAFGHEVDERKTLTPEQARSWKAGIAKLLEDEAEEPTLVFPRWGSRGAAPQAPRKPEPPPVEVDAEDAEWTEVADVETPAPRVLALPAPTPPQSPPAGLLRAALALLAVPGCGPEAGKILLKAVPESFRDDADGAAWARAASEVLREFGEGLTGSPASGQVRPAPEPEPIDSVEAEVVTTFEPMTETVPDADEPKLPSVEAVEPAPEPVPGAAADPAETAGEPVAADDPAPETGRKPKGRPALGTAARVTGLRRRVWDALHPSLPMRKAEVARAMGHGRGAVIRAVEELVALGAAQDRGGQRYVRLPIRTA